MAPLRISVLATMLASVAARSVPSNVRDFYNKVSSQTSCDHELASGFYSSDDSGPSSSYCADKASSPSVIYLHSTLSSHLVNMDIDCDGIQGGPADDGRCGDSGDTQSITSFQDTVESYGTGQRDLDANSHPYVVFGNVGSKGGNWANFNPEDHGVKPLSVMAVVCGDKLIYGVWGDENGDDGAKPVVGEASISLATACFGKSVNGNSGHDETDVLFIAFPGDDAVPGANGAAWAATSYDQFENSITALGDKLIQRIGGGSGGGGGDDPGSGTCSWAGHCQGASCGSDDDCSDALVCLSGKCASDSRRYRSVRW